MIIYRVEDANHIGPYIYRRNNAESDLGNVMGLYYDSDRHPAPSDDIGMMVSAEMRFGFNSLEQLDDWFNGAYDAFAASGFHIAVYDVPLLSVYSGTQQVMFRYDSARLIDVLGFEYMDCVV